MNSAGTCSWLLFFSAESETDFSRDFFSGVDLTKYLGSYYAKKKHTPLMFTGECVNRGDGGIWTLETAINGLPT